MDSQSTAVRDEVARIKGLNVSDPQIVFSSGAGPCRYNAGEDPAIREAKYQKITESIRHDRN